MIGLGEGETELRYGFMGVFAWEIRKTSSVWTFEIIWIKEFEEHTVVFLGVLFFFLIKY